MNAARYFHGGRAGLRVGWLLVPSPPHQQDGCPICVARGEGRTMRVGEWRAWLEQQDDPRAADLARQLVGVDPDVPIDPPSAQAAVYITSDLRYARWYAARSGNGDLYEVRPVGPIEQTVEDHFPAWTTPAAKIIRVLKRCVVLTRTERRHLLRAWREADERAQHESPATQPTKA